MKTKKTAKIFNNPVDKFKKIDGIISSVSNLTDYEKKELALANFWALLENAEIIPENKN